MGKSTDWRHFFFCNSACLPVLFSMPGDYVEERTINAIKTTSNSLINKPMVKLSTRLPNNKIPISMPINFIISPC
jgi:hypothetical protein